MYWLPKSKNVRPVDPIIPSLRDGSPFWTSQAINCLATIIQSLRDNKPSVRAHIFDSTSLRAAGFEDEDEDSLPDVAFGLAAGSSVTSEVGRTIRR